MAIRQLRETHRRAMRVSLDVLKQDDRLIASDGVELGTLQGLYEGGPWHGHVLVQGKGDDAGRQDIYTIPAWSLERRDEQTRSVYVAASAAHSRANWLVDVVG